MNKSKFLKRSLAALLAILMVVAMIPASAFAAAGDPDVIKIGGVAAELNGTQCTVNLLLPSGTSGIVETTLKALPFELRSDNGTTVAIFNKDGKQLGNSLQGIPDLAPAKKTVDVWKESNHPDPDDKDLWGDYTGMKLRVTEKGKDAVDYDLVITVSQRHASNDTTLREITSTRIVLGEFDNEKQTITITKPIGTNDTATQLGLEASNFTPTSNYATVSLIKGTGAESDIIKTVRVTAEDKSWTDYKVSYKVEKIFDSFGVKDVTVLNEVTETENNHDGQVNMTVQVPYGTKESELIPTFVPTDRVKTIEASDAVDSGFTATKKDSATKVDLFNATIGKTTSGVANWTAGVDAQLDEAGASAALTAGRTYKLNVRTSVSSNWNTTERTNVGTVKITFIPVKNPDSTMTGVKVSTQSWGATSDGQTPPTYTLDANDTAPYDDPPYNQVMVDVDGTHPIINVGDIDNDHLNDRDNRYNSNDIIATTIRDIKLFVPKDSKITWANPYKDYDIADIGDGTVESYEGIEAYTEDGNWIVEFRNVNLREYHNKEMQIKVVAENGTNYTDYWLTFNGEPGIDPIINGVTLHGETGYDDVTSVSKDVEGNIIVHVPFSTKLDGGKVSANFLKVYKKITVSASSGSTVYNGISTKGADADTIAQGSILNEKSDIKKMYSVVDHKGTDVRAENWPEDCDYIIVLDAAYNSTALASTVDVAKTAKYVYIYVDAPSTNDVIDSVSFTNQKTLLASDGNVFEGEINPDNRTIKIKVPYSFDASKDGAMYFYKVDFNGNFVASETDGAKNGVGYYYFLFDQLGDQVYPTSTPIAPIVTLSDDAITTVEGERAFDIKANGKKIKVWHEESVKNVVIAPGTSMDYATDSGSTGNSNTYYVYAVRQPANSEHKLNSITSSDPNVTVALDEAVSGLNRFIVTIPENYDSKDGVSQSTQFELSFNRSEMSTLKNGSNTWCGAKDTTAEFKVYDGKLYYKGEKVTYTNSRIIHLTVTAEDGRGTGEYELEIRTKAPSDDASIKSIIVDENTAFTADGENGFVVKDLSGDVNYNPANLPVTITTTEGGATVTVDGKPYTAGQTTVDLSEDKTAKVVVTAPDGVTQKTYTLSMSKGTTPDVKPSDSYTDLDNVYSGHRERVIYAIDNGLMSNDGTAGVFNSEGKIARQDFALIVARADMRAENPDAEDVDALLREKYADTPDAFDDIAKLNATQKAALAYCKEKNIISGNGKGGFNPAGAVSREDAAIIIASWCGLEHTDTENTNNIKDWNNVSSWAKPFVNAAYKAGLMNGTGNDNFTPARNLNRGEAAYIIVGALDQKVPSSN